MNCKFCKCETTFICHYEEWESPVYWCSHCGAIGISGYYRRINWTKPDSFKKKADTFCQTIKTN
jgi:hypothetical protein